MATRWDDTKPAKENDVAKPLNGYDFGDDWLNDIEEVLDFDDKNFDIAAFKEKPKKDRHPTKTTQFHPTSWDLDTQDSSVKKSENQASISDLLGIDAQFLDAIYETLEPAHAECVQMAQDNQTDGEQNNHAEDIDMDDGSLDIDFSEPEESAHTLDTHKPVVAQMLNIATLKKEIVQRKGNEKTESREKEDPLKDPQLWQFVSLIAMRLFDDLELIIVQKNCEEAGDLAKQLNRLSNILAFAGLGIHLPLIAYIGRFLPLTFTDAEIGEPSERLFDNLKVRFFFEKSGEFLNCLVYLFNALEKIAPDFNTARFNDTLDGLYKTLNIQPAEPSIEAPLAVTDSVNPQELTSRTINKLARTLEALVTESLHYIESSVFYGYSNGYHDAAKSLNSATQIAREYKLKNLEPLFAKLYMGLKSFTMPKVPPQAFFNDYAEVCRLLEIHFSRAISEKKFKHLKALIAKFGSKEKKTENIPFQQRWTDFMKNAAPLLELERIDFDAVPQRTAELTELSKKYRIQWLTDTFEQLTRLWPAYSLSCAEALVMLIEELRAFPTQDIEESDIEQLNHERLRVLFARKPEAKPMTAFALVDTAQKLAETISEQMEYPANISSEALQNLLIDARQIKCHAIARACQVMLSLLERIPQGNGPVNVAESVVDALYFCTGFLQTICTSLKQHLDHDPNSPAVTSLHSFYAALLALYQTPGQPRDAITWFILKRINAIQAELQLVWANTSTPTSTEYYCSIMRKLLHIATVCELREARQALLEHLDEIPPQDFINTENRTMKRQCGRIMMLMNDTAPKLNTLPATHQVKLFFTKTIAALNQLLSSRDVNDPIAMRTELARIEARMSMLGMTTDFPPVIAFIYELRYNAFAAKGERAKLEDLLYEMINVANNVCPEWIQPKETELEFVKSAVSLPMPFFQELLESVTIIKDALEHKSLEEPVAWERISMLHKDLHKLVGYMPYNLQLIAQNAQNRCRYLKKNIYIDVNTNGYPHENDLTQDTVSPVIAMAFATVIDKLIEAIIDNAFLATDYSSRISITLQPFPKEFSASISHNGKLFTVAEMTDRLEKVNIMPAIDDNIFDLLVSSKRLTVNYPPVNALAYILPILRQFDGRFEASDDNDGNTRFYVRFKL